eukprot:Colp12_sorted_trinity150504_noHs@26008
MDTPIQSQNDPSLYMSDLQSANATRRLLEQFESKTKTLAVLHSQMYVLKNELELLKAAARHAGALALEQLLHADNTHDSVNETTLTYNDTLHQGEFTDRQKKVVESFLWAWKGYKEYAWGEDELMPLSQRGNEWFNVGLTLIDSLDALLMMNLKKEFWEAREWVSKQLNFDQDKKVNLFEITIRVMGGLLSAYALTGDKLFAHKAEELGIRLLPAFNSKSGIPFSDVNLHTLIGYTPDWTVDSSSAEVTSIQLEFKYLSRITKNAKYHEVVDNVMKHVTSTTTFPRGLLPIYISPVTGQFSGNTITLGARGDSYYEYLLKQWLLSGKKEKAYLQAYEEAVRSIKAFLVKRSHPSRLTYIAELVNYRIKHKMDHLVCFLPGTLALGHHHGVGHREGHLDLARELMYTCYQLYKAFPSGLAPEIMYFNGDSSVGVDMGVAPADTHNLLRPETVESLFVLNRVTGDKKYRDWGWEIFEAFEAHCRVSSGGYTSVKDVTNTTEKLDKMESFFLSETLKYLFMLFSDDPKFMSLDHYVFNTEGHPLPIARPAV